ncbi:oxidoreductase [Streptomyces sp. NPDC006482]|uniref:oxidoreductase n=1 Tax=Streptomyces sp. NPDC006482 TaxID=3154306 RepID=UPI0033AF90D1
MTIPPGPPYGYGYGYPPPPPPPQPGVIPLAPLGLGAVLSGAFSAFGRHWKQLIGVTAAVYGSALLLVAAALLIAYAAVSDRFPAVFDLPAGQEPQWVDLRPLIIAFTCVWVVGLLAALGASAVMAAACPAVIQEAVLGRPTTFGALWRRSWSRMPAVLGTVLLTSVALMLPVVLFLLAFFGLFLALLTDLGDLDGTPLEGDWSLLAMAAMLLALLVTPLALWIWIKFSLAPAAAVMEGQGVFASMRRSSALIRGSWWRVFGILLLVGLITTIASWLIQQLLSTVAWIPMAGVGFTGGDAAALITGLSVTFTLVIIGQLISQLIVSVFPPLVTALLYVDQRIRKENLAPELARAAGLA